MNLQKITDIKNHSIENIIRPYTLSISIITLCIIIHTLFCYSLFYHGTITIGLLFKLFTVCIFFISMTIFFFKATFLKLFSASHVFIGFVLIIGGESVLGCLLFFIGWIVAIRYGFFSKNGRIKIFFVAILLTTANICNLLFEMQITVHRILLTAASFATSVVLFFILMEYLKEVKNLSIQHTDEIKSRKASINLSDYAFNYNELYALAATLRDEPYYAISLYLAVSESAIKKMMLNIYGKFGYKNRELFMNKIAGCELVYPEWFKLPD